MIETEILVELWWGTTSANDRDIDEGWRVSQAKYWGISERLLNIAFTGLYEWHSYFNKSSGKFQVNSFLASLSANFAFRMKHLDGSKLFLVKNMLVLIDIVVNFQLQCGTFCTKWWVQPSNPNVVKCDKPRINWFNLTPIQTIASRAEEKRKGFGACYS